MSEQSWRNAMGLYDPWGDDGLDQPGPTEPGTWHDPSDTEQRWGYGGMAEPTCRHGVTGQCVACETECVHGNYGPGCPTCRDQFYG